MQPPRPDLVGPIVARALIVDDEQVVREAIAAGLTDRGCDVFAAANAADALTLLGDGSGVDVLVTDIRMPGEMDGIALARTVVARYPVTAILIMSSARPEPSVISPFDGFIAKPFELRILIERVIAALALKRIASN
jgi:CheY-like chemotaxis protein